MVTQTSFLRRHVRVGQVATTIALPQQFFLDLRLNTNTPCMRLNFLLDQTPLTKTTVALG